MKRVHDIADSPPEGWEAFNNEAKLRYLSTITEVKMSETCPNSFLKKIFRFAADKGLFARCDMPAGTFVGEYIGRSVTSRHEMLDMARVFWPKTEAYPEGFYSEVGMSFSNHSRNAPNMAPKEGSCEFYLIEDVKAGDELLWRYGDYDY